MKKLAMLLALLLVCSLAFARGNKNDLAYKAYDELRTVNSLSDTNELIVVENNIPKRGTSIAAILALASSQTLSSLTVSGNGSIGGNLAVAGLLSRYRVAVVDDETTYTLLATDSGKVFVANATATFTLPTASSGLIYKIVDGAGVTINLVPGVTTDTIKYLTLDAGDKITSPGATADSVELIGVTGKWYVGSMKGTWTDGGQ